MLNSIEFEYDESKNPNKKRKRVVTEPYKCSKCGRPKKGHSCEAKKAKTSI